FYIEELQAALKLKFPDLPNISTTAICRILRFDLGLTRKVLTKRARESVPAEIEAYYKKLPPFYRGPDQLVFLDETAKVGRSVLRRFAWSPRNTPAIVRQPFDTGTSKIVCCSGEIECINKIL
ncbi:Transposase, partial [Phytophthora megakarya]